MSFRLVPLVKGKIPIIPLIRPVLLVGRHPECDIQLTNLPISRFHCCLALAYDRILVRDLGSRNGLRVNGLVVEEAQLFSGDEVAIGPIIFRLVPEPELANSAGSGVRKPPPTPSTLPAGTPAPEASLPPPSSHAEPLSELIDLIPIDED